MGLIQVPLLGCAVIRHLQKSAGLTLEEDIFILELHFTETQGSNGEDLLFIL